MKLSPLTSAPKIRRLAAFDVQGDANASYVVGSLVTQDDEAVSYDPDALIEAMTTRQMRGQYLYSHRLTYDLGVLIPHLPSETPITFLKEKLFKGRLPQGKRHRVYCVDSSFLWSGLSLTEIAFELGMTRNPPPLELNPRYGHNATPTLQSKATYQAAADYSLQDARIVLAAMNALQDEVLALGGQVKNTLASTALDLYRRNYLDREYYTPYPYRNQFARRAYYGGRCEPFCLGEWTGVNVYDIHSHYPHQMATQSYPNPNSTIGPREPGRLEWIMELEGVSNCLVDVPRMKFPPLPYRQRGQTYFPFGEFRGTWCHNELRYAIEQGVRVKRVFATMYSEDSVRPFVRFVHDLWEKRQRLLEQGSIRARIYKLLLNSLSGKFGQRPEGGLFELMPADAYLEGEAIRGTEFVEIAKMVYAKLPVSTRFMPRHIIVMWSAYITAYGRIALHRLMLNCPDETLYVDTDSLFTFGQLPTGDSLGELGLQATSCFVDLIAPKMYMIVTSEGQKEATAKGVPLAVANEYCTYKEVEYYKALGWLEAARQKLNPSAWSLCKKSVMHAQPKRKYRRVPGVTSPRWLSEPLDVDLLP